MNPPLDLADYLRARGLNAEIVDPGAHMPTVEAAAVAMGCPPDQIFKSILFETRDGRCAMAIACGRARIDPRRLAALTKLPRLRLAPPDVVLRVTGYPAGGTPPVGHREHFPVVVDRRVAAQPWGYAGGGRAELLVKIRPADIVELTAAMIDDVVSDPDPAGKG
jgi:prolyl-tRNA editing enzyme YbaK/EbsC (Cys-tRNA(Pro) deacylase)